MTSSRRLTRRVLFAAAGLLTTAHAANAADVLDSIPAGPLRDHIRWFVDVLNDVDQVLTPDDVGAHFSADFLRQIPAAQVTVTIDQLRDVLGTVMIGRVAKASDSVQAGVQLVGSTGVSALLTIWIDDESALIDGLTIEPDDQASESATPVFEPAAFAVGLTELVGGFSQPLFLTHANDGSGRLFVVEKGGAIRIIRDGAILAAPFLDLTAQILSDGYEQGLLGLAFAPDYADSGLFYVDYIDLDGNTVVSRFSVSDDADLADPGSEQVILRQAQPYANHNGGMLAFGADQYLYIGFGDGGSGGDPQGNAQRLDTWLGKILRIDVDPSRIPADQTYGIPEDNPFVDVDGALPEIWAYGLRNPWRFSFDAGTGDLWIGDVGQDVMEEIDWLPRDLSAGQNLGWNTMEGSRCYLEDGCDASGLLLPVLEYTHEEGGCAVTGGYVYRGTAISELVGTYLFGDYCSGLLWGGGRDADGAWVKSEPVETGLGISSFGEDAEGNVYVTDLNGGGVYRIVSAS